jgi:hypothetical protein
LDCLQYLHETAKAPWDLRPYEKRTRTTTPTVYNTSSTTTVHYHLVGLTKVENYTHSLIVERGKREKHKLNKARTRLYYQPVSLVCYYIYLPEEKVF